MKTGILDYEINVDTKDAKKAFSELAKAAEVANQHLRRAQDILNAMHQVGIVFEINEKKKKWFEFWKL